jgi:hypothetical protein
MPAPEQAGSGRATTAGRRNREDHIVKITIDVDCTPAEAREFFGLPDLRPLQAAWLAEVEKRLVGDMQKFSPEGIARSWLSGAGADWLPNMFGAFASQLQPAEKDEKPSRWTGRVASDGMKPGDRR